jgi:hypothetical protein
VVTISPSTSSLTCQVPLMSSYCARRQSEWSHSKPRSGMLTWHPSASTADSVLLKLRYYGVRNFKICSESRCKFKA